MIDVDCRALARAAGLSTMLVGCLGAQAAGGQAAAAVPARPNVLWISAEDLSPDLGAYGDAYAVTPTLDRLAR